MQFTLNRNMKNATIIFRVLLGFLYLVFGLDYLLK
jgi:hypothetical protein